MPVDLGSGDDVRAERSTANAIIHLLVAALIFVVGFAMHQYATDRAAAGHHGFWVACLGDFGAFLAATVAVAFVYERVIHVRERRLFLEDLERLHERRMAGEQRGIQLYSDGRPPLPDKVRVIAAATAEVVEFGTAMRTFAGYFRSRPASDYKDHVVALLRENVHFSTVMVDPAYAAEHVGDEEGRNAAESLATLVQLAAEFKVVGHPGRFDVYTYAHPPMFAAICVDGDATGPTARLFFTPYLYKLARAEVPAFLISRAHRSKLFDKLWGAVKATRADATLVASSHAMPRAGGHGHHR